MVGDEVARAGADGFPLQYDGALRDGPAGAVVSAAVRGWELMKARGGERCRACGVIFPPGLIVLASEEYPYRLVCVDCAENVCPDCGNVPTRSHVLPTRVCSACGHNREAERPIDRDERRYG